MSYGGLVMCKIFLYPLLTIMVGALLVGYAEEVKARVRAGSERGSRKRRARQ